MPGLHLVITTHTTRHLRRTLLGVSLQKRRPDLVVVSCDNDGVDVREMVRECSEEFAGGLGGGVGLVRRPSLGVCAASQVRNNGVRAVMGTGAAAGDRVLFLDGDCCPGAEWAGRHEAFLTRADLSIGFRVDLTPEQTGAFDEDALRRGEPPAPLTRDQRALLGQRQKRYARSLFLRALRVPFLVKPHKPKVLSANFGVRLEACREINGFDEEYLGYGQEDDDFSRRIYGAGLRAAVAISTALAFHQWHPTRAPGRWRDAPGVARFERPWIARCARGLENAVEQAPPQLEWFERGRAVRTGTLGQGAA